MTFWCIRGYSVAWFTASAKFMSSRMFKTSSIRIWWTWGTRSAFVITIAFIIVHWTIFTKKTKMWFNSMCIGNKNRAFSFYLLSITNMFDWQRYGMCWSRWKCTNIGNWCWRWRIGFGRQRNWHRNRIVIVKRENTRKKLFFYLVWLQEDSFLHQTHRNSLSFDHISLHERKRNIPFKQTVNYSKNRSQPDL